MTSKHPQILSTPSVVRTPSRRLSAPIAIGSGAAGAVALAAVLALWARYGTTMFFDMIASGIAACF